MLQMQTQTQMQQRKRNGDGMDEFLVGGGGAALASVPRLAECAVGGERT